MTDTTTTSKPRLLGLDALRGIAVFLMIEQHLGVWLWNGPEPGKSMSFQDYPVLVVFNALGGGAAPAFVTLAGIGSSLLANARTARGQSPDKTLFLRGLAVLAFGYLLSWLTPSWFTWRSWFVLHLMGTGMLLTPLLRRLPTGALIGLALAVLGVTGVVQATLDVPVSLDNDYMAGRAANTPEAWAGLRIMIAEGQFPIFPWLAFYLAGLACGRWIARAELDRIWMLSSGVLAFASIGILLRGVHAPVTSMIGRTSSLLVPFFPASPTLASLLLAVVLLGIWAMMAWDREHPLRDNNPIVTLGRASLTLLILHVWLFREATRPIGVWQALDLWPATAVLFGFVLIAIVGARLWQRADYRLGAEWLLRKLAP
jgi:uncharacterized membrane protein